MNAMTMLESVSDRGIRELSLDEIEMIGGGHNTRGMPRRPERGGGWRAWVIIGVERTVDYVWNRWGGTILEAVDRYGTARANYEAQRYKKRYGY